ncbi:MAG: ABC transporter permease [Vicinamibacterales bacterium]
MGQLIQDLRYGLRAFLRTPGFSVVAVLVLALGIGANSAMFTVVNALLFRPLAGRAGELVGLFSHDRTKPDSYRGFSHPNYADIRERNTVFAGLMAHTFALVGVPAGDTTRRAFAEMVSSNYFSTLAVPLAAGREFNAAEERPRADIPVVIVNYERWRDAGFGADFIGRTVKINARDFTVVGVAPRGFTGTMALVAPEFWLPLGTFDTVVNDIFKNSGAGLGDRTNHALVVAGRLKDEVTVETASPALDTLGRQMAAAFPAENKDQALTVNPLPRMSTSTEPQTDTPLAAATALLMGMSAIVLIIACLNIANMLLARGAARRREIAVRLALGGRPSRIVRQLLTESLALALAGAAAGLALAFWAMNLLASSLVPLLPLALEFDPKPDANVLAVTIVFAVLSTLTFGLGPALKLSHTDVVVDLKDLDALRARGDRRRWFGARNLLVVGQIALSLALLVAGGLFARGAMNAAAADPGFRYERIVLASLDPGLAGYDEARTRTLYRNVMERVRAIPGVEAVTITSIVPFGEFQEGRPIERPGGASATEGGRSPSYMIVGADYFKTLGLRMLRGREFTRTEEESPDAPRVAIINEPLARRLFPNEDPLGQMIRITRHEGQPSGVDFEPMQVVGAAPGLRASLFDQGPVPHLYVPAGNHFRTGMHLHARTARGGPEGEAAALTAVRSELRAVDDRLPVLVLSTMQTFHDRSLGLWGVRMGGRLLTTFGALALILAVVGVYGVKSYVVSQRTREIGIRMALGARPASVLWLVLREGVWLTAIGLAIGLPLAALAGSALSGMLYQVSPLDPIVFSMAPIVLAVTAVAACYLPARRATRIMPLTALRTE